MPIRRMRDLVAAREQHGRGTPRDRHQALRELARLEHEKARLQQTLEVWLNNQRRTERQLQQVLERIDLLQRQLQQAEDQSRPAQPVRQQPNDDEGWQTFTLEY